MFKRSVLLLTLLAVFIAPSVSNVQAVAPCNDLSDTCMMGYLDYLGRYMATRPAPHYGEYTSPNGKLFVRTFYHGDGTLTVLSYFKEGIASQYVSYADGSMVYVEYYPYGTQWKRIVRNVVRADCKRNHRCNLL